MTTPDDQLHSMAQQLLVDGFEHTGPSAVALSDPLADTPMVVTLEQLRPYELNPRVTRNPLYDDIKASIRERGLDAPPAITRRPGEPHFIIRNGGNTRLAILRELWTETKDEQFFRIACLFRPWHERGEIVALTGHLAENELHGGLTFIERALGVEKARELYEQEGSTTLTQAELARRLTLDGYPVHQSHISRMRDAVQYLLPAIPSVLYGGLGRHQVERLAVLRRSGERIWQQHAQGKLVGTDFATLFQDVLQGFDGEVAAFSLPRVQDELIGLMSDCLQINYDSMALDIDTTERRQVALLRDPAPVEKTAAPPAPTVAQPSVTSTKPEPPANIVPDTTIESTVVPDSVQVTRSAESVEQHSPPPTDNGDGAQSIHGLVAEQLQDTQIVDGLHLVSELWHVDTAADHPACLRVLIAQLAAEIAADAGHHECVETLDYGIGYSCHAKACPEIDLLQLFSGEYEGEFDTPELRALLVGGHSGEEFRLSDAGLIKLFRLVLLARRLIELESSAEPLSCSPSPP